MAARAGFGQLVLTFFRHGSNVALALTLGALVLTLGLGGQLGAQAGWLAVGLAMFPFYEYVFHRFLLHAKPAKLPWAYRIQRATHYDHHEDTNRLDRLFTPIWAFFPLVAAQGGLYLALGIGWPTAAALLSGNLLGYVYYEWVHYIAHVPYAPRTAWGRAMKKYHLWHHHKNEHHWFGVTTPWVDRLFGTYAAVEAVPQSASARRLHGPHTP